MLRRAVVAIGGGVWPIARLWYRIWGLFLHRDPDDAVWYFAYGANMHRVVFVDRRGMRPETHRVGRLAGYRLRFNLDGRPKGRAAPANIALDPASEVWGVLYRITWRQLFRLNASEGVPGRRYRPISVAVEQKEGPTIEAVTYLAQGNEHEGWPSLRYITLLREGARAHGLPDHWVAVLEAVEDAETGLSADR